MSPTMRASKLIAIAALALAAGCGDDDDPVSPQDAVLITSGTPVTGIAGGENSLKYYRIVVPSGATELTVTTAGGTGDVDLYVRRGQLPTFLASDCSSEGSTNDEVCTIADPATGDWFIMLEGFEAYTAVTLTGTVTTP